MAVRRPYVRPVDGWWRRNPFFLRYMAREMTAPFVGLYAFILLAGIACLALGRDAFEAWVGFLRSPFSSALHAVLVAVFAYHTATWFAIMPKTMPPLVVGGRKVAPRTITAMGLAAAAACMLGLWVVAGAIA